MNPTEIRFLTARLDQQKVSPIVEGLLPLLQGVFLQNEIPLPLTSRDEWKIKVNIKTLTETIEHNGYHIITGIGNIHEVYAPRESFFTVAIDFDNAIAFTGYIEGGIPVVIICDIKGNRIMVYKNDINSFQFRDEVRPVLSKHSPTNVDES
ncbi:MAG: hypothetical protein ACMG57_01760 [Candidatus Dojkabacteria bacterium]